MTHPFPYLEETAIDNRFPKSRDPGHEAERSYLLGLMRTVPAEDLRPAIRIRRKTDLPPTKASKKGRVRLEILEWTSLTDETSWRLLEEALILAVNTTCNHTSGSDNILVEYYHGLRGGASAIEDAVVRILHLIRTGQIEPNMAATKRRDEKDNRFGRMPKTQALVLIPLIEFLDRLIPRIFGR